MKLKKLLEKLLAALWRRDWLGGMANHTPDTQAQTGAGAKPPARLRRFFAYKWFYVCAASVLVPDQVSKAWVARILPFDSYGHGAHIEVIPGFFNIVHVGNTGAAWSILSGHGGLLAVFAVVVLIAIFFARKAIGLRDGGAQIALGLMCGGIVGNLVDRLMHNHVIDFLDFAPPLYGRIVHALFGWPADSHYPAFNIADAGICAGAAIYFAITLFSGREKKAGS